MKNKDYVVDTVEMDEEDMLELFDKDNPSLGKWTKDQKVAMVRKSIFLDEKIKNEQS